MNTAKFWTLCIFLFAFLAGCGGPELESVKKAADAGDADAMHRLGVMYQTGKGAPENFEEAIRWYEKSVNAGNAKDLFQLGSMYYERGVGAPQNFKESILWYKKAAKAGDAESMFMLGSMYGEGKGVDQSSKEAEIWYKKAANAGHVHTMNLLGVRGLKSKDYKEAVRWLKKSASSGDSQGMWFLGGMYYQGNGVPQNHKKTYMWWTIGDSMDYKFSEKIEKSLKQGLKQIQSEMSKQDISLAKDMSAKCLESNFKDC